MYKFALGIAFAALATLTFGIAKAQAKQWYVSPSSTATERDGSSWEKAWKDFSEISWSSMQSGDRLALDAGSVPGARVVYNKPLHIYRSNIVIESWSGRDWMHGNGYAVISVPKGTPAAVDFEAAEYTSLECWRWQGLQIEGGEEGLRIGSWCHGAIVRNVAIRNAERVGLHTATNAYLRQVVVKDNPLNVLVDVGNNASASPHFFRCWIHNRDLTSGPGIEIRQGNDMHLMPDTASPTFEDSVIGPGLSTAVAVFRPQVNVNLRNCLLLNAQQHNFQKNTDESSAFILQNCTSFMTPLNAQGMAHTALNFDGKSDKVLNSVFWGGVVKVPATAPKQVYNCQYRTTGNGLYLSARQVNPLFVGNVGAIPNTVKNSDLTDRTGAYYSVANFSLRAISPIYTRKWGSSIYSIQKLIQADLPY